MNYYETIIAKATGLDEAGIGLLLAWVGPTVRFNAMTERQIVKMAKSAYREMLENRIIVSETTPLEK